jgi:hypothetical protein
MAFHPFYPFFEEEILINRRYIYDDYIKETLSYFKSMINLFKTRFPSSQIFYRAQKGNNWQNNSDQKGNKKIPIPFTKERLFPFKDRSKEGRVNPKGIPCLYLTNNIETCIMETRPWFKEILSVATFTIKDGLTFIDFSDKFIKDNPNYNKINDDSFLLNFWFDINDAYSTPLSNDDDTAYYAPTQILSELIKNEKYDGVIYNSKLGSGINIALFNMENADYIDCNLYTVNELSCFYSEL